LPGPPRRAPPSCQGGNNFAQEKGSLRCGILKKFVPACDQPDEETEEVGKAVGISLFESPDDEVHATVMLKCLTPKADQDSCLINARNAALARNFKLEFPDYNFKLEFLILAAVLVSPTRHTSLPVTGRGTIVDFVVRCN
jgi:hypothetical protein